VIILNPTAKPAEDSQIIPSRERWDQNIAYANPAGKPLDRRLLAFAHAPIIELTIPPATHARNAAMKHTRNIPPNSFAHW
jgi:hypothetical protein